MAKLPADPTQVDQSQNMGEPDSTPPKPTAPPVRSQQPAATPAPQTKAGHTGGDVGTRALTAAEIAFYDKQIDEAFMVSSGTTTGTVTAFKALLSSIRTEQANLGVSDRGLFMAHEHIVKAARDLGATAR